MPIGIANHHEVADDAANICGWLDQDVFLLCELGNAINLRARIALETEMIEAELHFILDYDQNKNWIFIRAHGGTEPDVVAAFEPAIANNRKAAEARVEIN